MDTSHGGSPFPPRCFLYILFILFSLLFLPPSFSAGPKDKWLTVVSISIPKSMLPSKLSEDGKYLLQTESTLTSWPLSALLTHPLPSTSTAQGLPLVSPSYITLPFQSCYLCSLCSLVLLALSWFSSALSLSLLTLSLPFVRLPPPFLSHSHSLLCLLSWPSSVYCLLSLL